jgi:hypothetical protein
MTLRTLRLTTASLLAALALTAACTERDADVETQDPAAAEQIVDQYAQASLTYSGQAKFSTSSIHPSPCEGKNGESSDTIYTMVGIYQLLVPGADQLAMLNRLRDAWRAQDYTITSQRTFPPGGRGEITATNPNDGVLLTLRSGLPPAMLLTINTKCRRRPA